MAKINLTEEVLKHDDDEIIEYLANEAKAVRGVFTRAINENSPDLLYASSADLEIMTAILIALDRRNKERRL